MFAINIQTNIRAFQDRVSRVAYQQIPFATAAALTQLARDVAKAEQDNEAKVLDRPRPFTQGAIRVLPARKGSNMAKVVMQDITARYLEPYEFGGKNVLNGRVLLKPIGAAKDLDQFGNLPRRLTAQLKARSDVFVGTVQTKVGPVTGIWQRSSEAGSRIAVARIRKDGTVRMGKTGKGLQSTGRLKLLIKFSEAHPIDEKNRLHWFEVAQATVTKNFNRRFGAALAKAIATRKT